MPDICKANWILIDTALTGKNFAYLKKKLEFLTMIKQLAALHYVSECNVVDTWKD